MSKKAQDSSENLGENPSHVTLTVDKANAGQFDFSGASITVDFAQLVKLGQIGFKAELQSLLGEVDSHALFGNYAEKGQTRPKTYSRSAVAFNDARAEVVRAALAKGTDATGHVAVTVTQYIASNWIVAAKDSITRKAGVETSLVKLAQAANFEFENWQDLTIENVEFVKAVAQMLSSI